MVVSILWTPPSSVSVGVTTTVALAAFANRQGAIFVNDSANTIYLGIGADAVLNSGIRLNANGGSYEMTLDNVSGQAVNAISSVAASVLTVQQAGK